MLSEKAPWDCHGRCSSAGFAGATLGLLASDAWGPAHGRPAARTASWGEVRKGGEAALRMGVRRAPGLRLRRGARRAPPVRLEPVLRWEAGPSSRSSPG